MIKMRPCSNCQAVHAHIRRFSNSFKTEDPNISKYRFRKIKNEISGGKGITFGNYVLLAFPAATFGLGFWQTKRLAWKNSLVQELNKKKSAKTVDLPYRLHDIETLEYQKVRVRGKFDHSKEQYIGPRSFMNDGVEGKSYGLIGNSEGVGWHVVTPFCLEGGEHHGDTILINRGWVPNKMLLPKNRFEAQVEGTLDVEGVVRKTEQRPQFADPSRQTGNKWQYRDIAALSSKLNAEPIFLDADVHSTIPGGPIGGQTRVSLRNDHLTYLITWYTLSAVSLLLWCKRFLVK